MPELDTITVKGFKSIASIEKLKLGPINLLIGPNGSGKSNFVGVFSFLQAIREGNLQEYVVKAGGADKILHFGSKVTESINLHIVFKDGINQYRIKLQPTLQDSLMPKTETSSFWDKSKHPYPYDEYITSDGSEAGISMEVNAKRVTKHVLKCLENCRVYHFHDTGTSSPMKKTADVHDNRFFRPDGSNLASYLYFLHAIHPISYALIRKSVQQIAPFFDDFVLEPQKLNPEKIRLEWRHKGSTAYFDASALSDGTLRFIGLATLFLQPTIFRPSVIIVDEPELGLHPYAISLFAALVKQAAIQTQIILSTQSPTLLDHFEPSDVLVAGRVAGGTTLSRLDSNQLESWLESYSLGQLWEKNEIGGRPTFEHIHA